MQQPTDRSRKARKHAGSALPGRSSLRWGAANGQLCRLPCRQTSGYLADAIKTALLQKTRGDRRSVASRTVEEQGPTPRQFLHALRKVIQRDAQAAIDKLLIPFAGRPDIDELRGLARGQKLSRERRAPSFRRCGPIRS